MVSLIDGLSEIAQRPSDYSPRAVDISESKHGSMFADQQQKPRVHPHNYGRNNSFLKTAKNSAQLKDSALKSDGIQAEATSVSAGEVSTSHVDENGGAKRLTPDNCGLLPNTCLPCLSSTALSIEKRRPTSPETPTPSSRRKSLSKLSFKWKEGYTDMILCECSQYFSFIQLDFCSLALSVFVLVKVMIPCSLTHGPL